MLSNWDHNGPASAAGPGGWNDPDSLDFCIYFKQKILQNMNDFVICKQCWKLVMVV